jgi:hypothetical protein
MKCFVFILFSSLIHFGLFSQKTDSLEIRSFLDKCGFVDLKVDTCYSQKEMLFRNNENITVEVVIIKYFLGSIRYSICYYVDDNKYYVLESSFFITDFLYQNKEKIQIKSLETVFKKISKESIGINKIKYDSIIEHGFYYDKILKTQTGFYYGLTIVDRVKNIRDDTMNNYSEIDSLGTNLNKSARVLFFFNGYTQIKGTIKRNRRVYFDLVMFKVRSDEIVSDRIFYEPTLH